MTVTFVAIGGAIIVGASRGEKSTPGSPVDAAILARGAEIYSEACAACHGETLQGQPDWRLPGPGGRLPAPPHDGSGHSWHHSDRVLLDIMARGTAAVVGGGYQSDMPGFGNIYSDADLQAVLEWIKSRWPRRQQDYQAGVSANAP